MNGFAFVSPPYEHRPTAQRLGHGAGSRHASELRAIEESKAYAGLGEHDAWLKSVLRGFRWTCGCYIDCAPADGETVAAYRERLFAMLADPGDDDRPEAIRRASAAESGASAILPNRFRSENRSCHGLPQRHRHQAKVPFFTMRRFGAPRPYAFCSRARTS